MVAAVAVAEAVGAAVHQHNKSCLAATVGAAVGQGRMSRPLAVAVVKSAQQTAPLLPVLPAVPTVLPELRF